MPKKKTNAAESPQVKLSATEMQRLANRVMQDYRNALSDHQRRMDRWAEYTRRWEGTPEPAEEGAEGASNLPVPYIRWNVLAQWAKEMDQLFGDDAEIVAKPVGPSDFRRVKKIGKYMTWRVFDSMKLTTRFCVFVLRKILFGRSFAYAPWVRRTYMRKGKEIVDYEGPDFQPMYPDDFILPAEEHEQLHEFSFNIRKVRVTPDDLLRGVKTGRYNSAVEDKFAEIVALAQHTPQREPEGEQVKLEQDEASGISMTAPLSAADNLMVLEWYGKWRMLRNQDEDGDQYDLEKRELLQADLVVRVLPDLGYLTIAVQDLEELYPDLPNRRPFIESSLIKDGSYWSAGLGKMLIEIEDDLRQNHNLGTTAGEFTVGCLIFYRPATGSVLDKEQVEIKPRMLIPVDNPQSDVNVVQPTSNSGFIQAREQTLLAYGERLSGLSDPAMGRQSDRPNAPRTVGQTVGLLQEGNVRIALNTLVLREDMGLALQHFWLLEYMFSPAQMFFRVTEEDADGAFPVNDGGSFLERRDRDGRYDFELQFATSLWSREADKQNTLARYQIDMQNPLIVNNPSALWHVTKDAHEALGDPDFADLVPEPPDDDVPVNPREEFTRLLQGEEIHVHPMDNDELHMIRHLRDLQQLEKNPEPQPDTHAKLVRHYLEHIDQMMHKKAVQALAEKVAQNMGSSLPPQIAALLSGQGATPPSGAPGPGGPPAAGPPGPQPAQAQPQQWQPANAGQAAPEPGAPPGGGQ